MQVRDAHSGQTQPDSVLRILHNRGASMGHGFECGPGKAHAVTTQTARQTKVFASERTNVVEGRQGDVEKAGAP